MDECLDLPPGFRFHPTDEEIISHYLSPKIINHNFTARAIGEVDLNKCEPWDLPNKAKMGEKEWYFFCQKDRKYPTGMRTNRATESGYWKATGKDKEIFRGKILVGMKKTLVFYMGRAPKGEKTNWVMHEYRLESRSSVISKSAKDEWAVCRVFHKNNGAKKSVIMAPGATSVSSFGDLMMDSPSLPPLADCSRPSSSNYCFNSNINDMTMMNPISGANSSSYFSTMMGLENDVNPYSMFATRQCKMEQFGNNHSMVSEDTGLSTDHHIESRYNSADRAGLDLDNMWKC